MNEVEIPAVCEVYNGSGPLVVRREDNRIMLDGHADQCCAFMLDVDTVDQLFDALGTWLSDRASWVLTPDGIGTCRRCRARVDGDRVSPIAVGLGSLPTARYRRGSGRARSVTRRAGFPLISRFHPRRSRLVAG